jgi:chromosomal replication initiation ATPase DnaA
MDGRKNPTRKIYSRNMETLAIWHKQQDELCDKFVDEVLPVISEVFNVPQEDIISLAVNHQGVRSGKLTRRPECVVPRQVLCWLAKATGEFAVSRLVRRVLKQDHATGVHSVAKINGYIHTNKELQDKMYTCCAIVYEMGYKNVLEEYIEQLKKALVHC